MERKDTFNVLCFLIKPLGCYPESPDYVEEYDLVVTIHDTSFDFKWLNADALPDSVVKTTGNLANGERVGFVNAASATIYPTASWKI